MGEKLFRNKLIEFLVTVVAVTVVLCALLPSPSLLFSALLPYVNKLLFSFSRYCNGIVFPRCQKISELRLNGKRANVEENQRQGKRKRKSETERKQKEMGNKIRDKIK